MIVAARNRMRLTGWISRLNHEVLYIPDFVRKVNGWIHRKLAIRTLTGGTSSCHKHRKRIKPESSVEVAMR